MKNIIIFSQYDLLRFYLKNLVDNLIDNNGLKKVINVVVYSSFIDLKLNVEKTKKAVVIIDTDGIPKPEIFRLSHLIHAVKGRSCLFTKEHESSFGYTGLKLDLSSCLISKTASDSYIAELVNTFIFNYESIYNEKIKINPERILTTRENEVCELLLSGMTNYDIAKRLAISNKTVSAHKTNIYTKYETKNLIDIYQRLK